MTEFIVSDVIGDFNALLPPAGLLSAQTNVPHWVTVDVSKRLKK